MAKDSLISQVIQEMARAECGATAPAEKKKGFKLFR
jgi:hypothetical protein